MLLHLVRHTKVDVPPGTCYGQSDVPLASDWEAEAKEIALHFSGMQCPIVYSSPLSRCLLLAKEISHHVVLDDRLKELNFGDWEQRPWNEITGPEVETWMNDYVNTRCPRGESHIDLQQRVMSFLDSLSQLKNDAAIIVSHAGVIRTIIAIEKKISLYKSFEIKVNHRQITTVHLP